MQNKLMSIANEVRESVFVVFLQKQHNVIKGLSQWNKPLGFGTAEKACNAQRFGSLCSEINKELH